MDNYYYYYYCIIIIKELIAEIIYNRKNCSEIHKSNIIVG